VRYVNRRWNVGVRFKQGQVLLMHSAGTPRQSGAAQTPHRTPKTPGKVRPMLLNQCVFWSAVRSLRSTAFRWSDSQLKSHPVCSLGPRGHGLQRTRGFRRPPAVPASASVRQTSGFHPPPSVKRVSCGISSSFHSPHFGPLAWSWIQCRSLFPIEVRVASMKSDSPGSVSIVRGSIQRFRSA
jgi:hypothetical protein